MTCPAYNCEFEARRKAQRFCSKRCAGLRPIVERLLVKRTIDPVTGCWIWLGSTNSAGYGTISWQGRRQSVHRVAFMVFIGPIPDGLHVDHVYDLGCRSSACFNPGHLEAVTVAENNRRSLAHRARKSHCDHGHVLTDNGVYISGGTRQCRECKLDGQRIAYFVERLRAGCSIRPRGERGRRLLAEARRLAGQTEALVELPSDQAV